MFNVIEHAMDDLGHTIISFRPTSSDFVTDENITFGQVCLDIVKQRQDVTCGYSNRCTESAGQASAAASAEPHYDIWT